MTSHSKNGLSRYTACSISGVIRRLAIALIVFAAPAANAYKVGDAVDPKILESLNIDPEKITVLDFFASWCASCKKEIPLLDAMQLDDTKVEILGVCTDKKIEKGKKFQKQLNIQFRVFDDTSNEVVGAFAPFGMPAIYFVKGGVVEKIHFGAMPKIDKIVAKDIAALSEN